MLPVVADFFFSEIDPKLMFLEYLAFQAIFKSKEEL
jgi:hypothetical protein